MFPRDDILIANQVKVVLNALALDHASVYGIVRER